ncbi:MAG TPA: xanthine dehydrogenase family protein molybdopterin-binding subunit, partial [Candidatus Methylomirabilis sp.]
LSVAFLRSPHAHARILGVDVSAVAGGPGIALVLTGEEAARAAKPIPSMLNLPGFRVTDWPALATGKVRFVGEPVAAVTAADRYLAEDAAERIRVTYEALPPVADAEQALRPDAARLHENLADNILFHLRHDNGQADPAFQEAEIILAETFRHPRCAGAPLENRGTIAAFDRATGTLIVWASTQIPHLLRTGLAQVLDFPESRLRVIAPAMGGGFGTKMHLFPEDIVVCLLTLRLGRPVKWVEDRREDLTASAHAREHINRAELAAKRDGTILGLKARLYCDVGAYSVYPVTAALEPLTASGILCGPYRIRGCSYDTYAVATNKCPTGAYRGVGMALGTFVRERLIDMLAEKIGMDPAEVRRRNFVRPQDFPYTSASGLIFDQGSYVQALEALAQEAGYEELRRGRGAVGNGRYRGVGIGCYNEFTGMGCGTFRRRGMIQVPGYDAATIKVDPTGQVRAYCSAASQGQGHATTLAQILADELGVSLADTTVMPTDTDNCPYGSGTFASRTIVVNGGAMILAARKLKEKVLRIAAHRLEAATEDLVLEGGVISVRGVPSRRITFREVAAAAYFPATGAPLPPEIEPGLEATHHYDPPPATFANGAHLAVVDVDIETGEVVLVRYLVVEDCGRMVNPMVVEGQVHGAVAQGIGNALCEDLGYDAQAQPLATTFMDYLLPSATTLPAMEVTHIETPPPVTLGGFKGMAEGGTIGATATLANAVADALAPLGIKVTDLPLSPERIANLVAAAKGGRNP